jgi:hypothetical protein
MAEQGHGGQNPTGLRRHQHGVQRAQPRAALLLADQQPRPAGLARGVPQVQGLASVQCLARGGHGLVARQRVPRGVLQEALLVGQLEVHEAPPPFPAAPVAAATVPA